MRLELHSEVLAKSPQKYELNWHIECEGEAKENEVRHSIYRRHQFVFTALAHINEATTAGKLHRIKLTNKYGQHANKGQNSGPFFNLSFKLLVRESFDQ